MPTRTSPTLGRLACALLLAVALCASGCLSHNPPPSSDRCASSTSCDACAARAGCGFCNGYCRSGTASGPSEAGACGGDTWRWLPSDCPGGADPCAQYSDACEDCTPARGIGCGWCNNSCHHGTESGPATPGVCGSSPWIWAVNSCPASEDPCLQYSDSCGDCTPARGLGCGWCNGHCFHGDESGPAHPTVCAGTPWVWHVADCP